MKLFVKFILSILVVLFVSCRKDYYNLQKDIVVHPIKFNDTLRIDLINITSDSLNIDVLNFQGNTVYHSVSSINNHYFEQYPINLYDINSGIYFCNISTLDTNLNVKIIKE